MKHPELEPEVMDAAIPRVRLALHPDTGEAQKDAPLDVSSAVSDAQVNLDDMISTKFWSPVAGNAISPEQATTALGRVRARRKDAGVPRSPKKLADAPAVVESSIGARLADLLESRDQAREKWLEWEQLAQEKLAIYTALDAELRDAIESLRGGGRIEGKGC